MASPSTSQGYTYISLKAVFKINLRGQKYLHQAAAPRTSQGYTYISLKAVFKINLRGQKYLHQAASPRTSQGYTYISLQPLFNFTGQFFLTGTKDLTRLYMVLSSFDKKPGPFYFNNNFTVYSACTLPHVWHFEQCINPCLHPHALPLGLS